MPKLKFNCIYCPESFDNVKELFDHYEVEHKNQEFRSYKITHRPSKQQGLTFAPTPSQACLRLGWDINDCIVESNNNNDTFRK